MAAKKCTRERACVVCGQMHARYKVCSPRCRELHNQQRKKAKRDAARELIASRPRTCACCESEKPGQMFKSATAVYCMECVPAGLTEDQTTHRVRWLRNGGPERRAEQERAKAEREHTRTLDVAQRLLGRIIGRQVRDANKGIAAKRKHKARQAGQELAVWNKPACNGVRSDRAVLGDLMKSRARSARRNGIVMLTDGTVRIEHVRGAESCLYCRAKLTRLNRVVDHMQPIALGGVHSASNVAQVCFACNMRKGSKSWADWLAELAPEDRRRADAFEVQARSLAGPKQWPAISGSKARRLQRGFTEDAGEMAAFLASFSGLYAAAPVRTEALRHFGA